MKSAAAIWPSRSRRRPWILPRWACCPSRSDPILSPTWLNCRRELDTSFINSSLGDGEFAERMQVN